MLKVITHPATNKTYKMGRIKRPGGMGPHLSFEHYATAALPACPPSGDYTKGAQPALSEMYLNDQLGDCVIAWMAHAEGVFTGNSDNWGHPVAFTDDQITKMYSEIGGYVPGDPSTDQGCDEVTALNVWQKSGFAGRPPIHAWMSVTPANAKQAIHLFENLMFGIELPDEWVNPMPNASGFTWDVAGDPDPNNGHCVGSAKWEHDGVIIETWGMNGLITNAAIAKYCVDNAGGALYTILTPEILRKATEKAPTGFYFSQLESDFKIFAA